METVREAPSEEGIRYRRAASKARTAELHGAKAGTSELGSMYRYAGFSECQGRLRTAYVRERAWVQGKRRLGPPKWVPIGIVCTACYVIWAAPAGEAAPDA